MHSNVPRQGALSLYEVIAAREKGPFAMASTFNIYCTGVGGQGIGLFAEILMRAADHSGQNVKAMDTHGLAQRGGIVISQLKIGDPIFSPLIPANTADLVAALERHEALRAVNCGAKDDGVLVYYDTAWQPLAVRLGKSEEVTVEQIEEVCAARRIAVHKVRADDLPDARMQNIVLLSAIAGNGLIPGVSVDDYKNAMDDLMGGAMLEKNLKLFEELLAAV